MRVSEVSKTKDSNYSQTLQRQIAITNNRDKIQYDLQQR